MHSESTLLCAYCGDPFLPRAHNAKFCSSSCQNRDRYRRLHPGFIELVDRAYRQPHPCEQCGDVFNPPYAAGKKRNRFCSPRCAQLARRLPEHLCKGCGNPFHPKSSVYSTYCSRECAFADKRSNATGALHERRCRVEGRQCPECSRWFVCGGPHGWGGFCSDDCRQAWRKHDANRRYRETFVSVAATNPVVEHVCRQCGKRFRSRRYSAVRQFCSKRCTRAASKGTRRARQRGARITTISRDAIFVRDAGKCGICGKSIDRSLKHPHPQSYTLDHIVPLSLGGAHESANIQAAHLRCNTLRGARGAGQLRLLG